MGTPIQYRAFVFAQNGYVCRVHSEAQFFLLCILTVMRYNSMTFVARQPIRRNNGRDP
jgi:hypothetical protein